MQAHFSLSNILNLNQEKKRVWLSINNKILQTTYNDLFSENYDLKILNIYKTHFKTQSGPFIWNNDFNNIRNSITQNNKLRLSQAITQLWTNLDTVTQNNYNAINMERNQAIEKWKQHKD